MCNRSRSLILSKAVPFCPANDDFESHNFVNKDRLQAELLENIFRDLFLQLLLQAADIRNLLGGNAEVNL